MKRAFSLALAGIVLLSSLLFFPGAVDARDVNECFTNHEVCRERAFNMNASWTKMALALTVCDIALGKCILTCEP
jgi:hypothetical protein